MQAVKSIEVADQNRQVERYGNQLQAEQAGANVETSDSVCTNQHPVSVDGQFPNLLGVVELILKDRPRLEQLIRKPSLQAVLLPQFLAVSLIGFTFFAVALAVVLSLSGVWPVLGPIAGVLQDTTQLIEFRTRTDGTAASRWFDGSAFHTILAYNLGLIAATGICLPSLYFYGLLSGIRMSLLDVTIHALKSKATAAVALVGILPIYVAVCLDIVIFQIAVPIRDAALWLGLVLPFVAGLWGTRSLYLGFAGLSDTIPSERRCRRECFLRRLVFSWAVCYTAVTPVMIYTLWEYLGR